jgi:serine/threonine-protein kinase
MGTQFGRYKVAEELGRGAMGVVYRAVDPTIGRTVAIKAINRSYLESVGVKPEEYAQRFAREAQVAGALNHAHVVKIYDLGPDYLVMEYVEGQTVAALLRAQGRLARSQALRVVSEAAAALDHAHASGVVHRDIKPANLMLQADGTTKVMDFGLARIESSTLTAAGEILGSAAYMAPEVVLGQAADARSDLFSLGVVAYELITGLRPFAGPTVSSIIHHVVRSEPRPARELDSSLPVEVDQVFARVLAKNPEQRFASASAFAQALAACPWADVPDQAPRDLPLAPGPLDPSQATMVLASASAILAPGALSVAPADDEGTGTVMSIDASELAEPLDAHTHGGDNDATRPMRAAEVLSAAPPAAEPENATAATVILRVPVAPMPAPPAAAAPPTPAVASEEPTAATVVLRAPVAATPTPAPPAAAAPPTPAVASEEPTAATVVLRAPLAVPPTPAPPAATAPPAPTVASEEPTAATVVLRAPVAATPTPAAAAPPAPAVASDEPTAATVVLRAPVAATPTPAPPAAAAPPVPTVASEEPTAATVVLRAPVAATPTPAPPAAAAPPAPTVASEEPTAATVVLRAPVAATPMPAPPAAAAPPVPTVGSEEPTAATVVLRAPVAATPMPAPPAAAAPLAPTVASEEPTAATVVLRAPVAAAPVTPPPTPPAPALAAGAPTAKSATAPPTHATPAADAPTPPFPLPAVSRPAPAASEARSAGSPPAAPASAPKETARKPAPPATARKRSGLGLVLLLAFVILALFAAAAGGFYWFVHRQAARDAQAVPTPQPVVEPTAMAPEPPVDTSAATPEPSPDATPEPATTEPTAAESASPAPSASTAPRPATLVVTSEPAGASVTIGKRRRGATPLRLAWPAGAVSVLVEKEGYKPWRADTRLTAGETRTLSARLEAATRPQEPQPPAATPAPTKPSLREGDLVPLGAEVTPPRRIGGESARMPNSARRLKQPASVLVEFVVDIEGAVRDAKVVESAGDALDAAALEALKTWRYEPARSHGLRVRVVLQAKFTFTQR